MMRETATRLDEPSEKASTSFFSLSRSRPVRLSSMMMIVSARKDAAICGNHQPHRMTPTTMRGKAAMNRTRLTLRRQVNLPTVSSVTSIPHCLLKLSRSCRV